MPTVLRIYGYRFFFFSNEGKEPVHVHVEHADSHAKFWLLPLVHLASSEDMSAKQLAEISKIVREHHKDFLEAWYGYFGG